MSNLETALGFAGINVIFLIFAKIINSRYSLELRTESTIYKFIDT